MFRVVNCVLIICWWKMQADITLSGTGYDKFICRTVRKLGKSFGTGRLGYSKENAEGRYVFRVSVDKYGYRNCRLQHMETIVVTGMIVH